MKSWYIIGRTIPVQLLLWILRIKRFVSFDEESCLAALDTFEFTISPVIIGQKIVIMGGWHLHIFDVGTKVMKTFEGEGYFNV